MSTPKPSTAFSSFGDFSSTPTPFQQQLPQQPQQRMMIQPLPVQQPKKKSKLGWWILFAFIVAGLGVGAYFLFRKKTVKYKEKCSSTKVCDTGLTCSAGSICLYSNGKACSADSDCNSAYCSTSGLCATKPVITKVSFGGSCNSTTKICDTGLGCSTDGICLYTNSHSCTTSSSCLSSYCSTTSGLCETLPKVGFGLACNTTDKLCDTGLSCSSTNVCLYENSQTCSSGTQCVSGLCSTDGKCMSSTSGTLHTVKGCESVTALLDCPTGKINAGTIKYGHWDTSCTTGTTSSFKEYTLQSLKTANTIIGKTSVTLSNWNTLVGEDPLPNVLKQFEVNYYCV